MNSNSRKKQLNESFNPIHEVIDDEKLVGMFNQIIEEHINKKTPMTTYFIGESIGRFNNIQAIDYCESLNRDEYLLEMTKHMDKVKPKYFIQIYDNPYEGDIELHTLIYANQKVYCGISNKDHEEMIFAQIIMFS
jgi:hypothetical protein